MVRVRYRVFAASSIAISIAVLVILARGTYDTFYFEPTDAARAQARTGVILINIGAALAVANGALTFALRGPRWSPVIFAAPALLVAACQAIANQTFFPQLALLVGTPVMVIGAVLMVLPPWLGPREVGRRAP